MPVHPQQQQQQQPYRLKIARPLCWCTRCAGDKGAHSSLSSSPSNPNVMGIVAFRFLGKVEGASSTVTDAVSDTFGVPRFFWDRCGWDANGFFKPYKKLATGRDGKCDSAENNAQQDSDKGYSYNWQYLGFATLASNIGQGNDAAKICQQLLCFDLSNEIRERIQIAFENSDVSNWIGCPHGFYAVLFSVIAQYFDQALWGFRKPLRELEKEELVTSRYLGMHEISRHVLHEIETLEISARTMRAIDDCHSKNCRWEAGDKNDPELHLKEARYSFCSSEISFYPQFLENLGLRAHTFEDRLKTEIRLAFHLAGADDNKTTKQLLDKNKEIAQSSRNDGRELTRLVSTATLLFLPGSFCSDFLFICRAFSG
ncbi:uncharacterized protein PpBr36_09445 [Pyricularia pennisetigena]|uniref:uncharacterized protein n=1 Tax=Pyricularia pennisetigena TaxID=1578925 RepID=UPI00114E4FA9|nr:uncharacterized protein PpBr36_09445 [Pyricularia pennisetigena]TLS21754.1 hypothetical protein PpBr36_09445 [Pyricularia pennisetigena]